MVKSMKRYPLSLLAASVITVASLIPVPEVVIPDVPLYDKWAHFIMYGGLCLIIWWEYLRQHVRVDWRRAFWGAVVAPIVMSGLLELAQAYLTTTRSGDWLDFVANIIGVLLALLLVSLFLTFRPS